MSDAHDPRRGVCVQGVGYHRPWSRRDQYYDHCRCTAVAVRPGQVYTPPDYVDQWEEQYQQAVRATADGGPIDTGAVLAKMDELEHPSIKAAASTADEKSADEVAAWLAAEKTDVPTPITVRTFTEAEGRSYGRDVWHDYAGSLDQETVDAGRTYTGPGYLFTNPGLRDGIDFGDTHVGSMRAVDAIRGLDAAIENAPRVPTAITVSRDVDASVFGIVDAADLASVVGRRFRDEAHLSTTMQSRLTLPIGDDQIELRLDVPAGTKALYVSSSDRNVRGLAAYGPDENELIVWRGIDYEIYGTMIGDDGRPVLLGRLVGQDAKLREVN
ncbi:ADP-ribosyltransferase [Rhodococcus sp. RS1C4]